MSILYLVPWRNAWNLAAVSASSRRTQADRSEESRARLLDAAIACLTERGYAGTTVAEVSRRAGLSIGCQQHHFPSKADLLVAAMERLFERRREELLAAIAAVPDSPDRGRQMVRLLWQVLSGPSFQAYLELVVASRTDADLRPHMHHISHRMGDETRQTFHALFAPTDAAAAYEPLLPALLFSLMEGLAFADLAMPGRDDVAATVKALEDILPRLIGPR
jgi:AcrR family transcriptional regulator